MSFTNKFPYTTINNINLDWIIKRVKELGTTVRSFAQDIARAVSLAEAAQEAAESVTSTAESAVATAQTAEATANAIAGTANTALATAQAAETTAQAAETTANAIAGTANTALATAQAAETTAQAAESAAQAAEESADNAETIAGTASANASNAVQTANTALATAEAALVMAGQGDVSALNEKAGKLVDTKSGAGVSIIPDRTIEQNLSVSVAVVPVQAGSGDPSPNNIRPISARNIVNIWNKPTYDPAEPPTVTVQLGQSVYGGTLNATGGTVMVNKVCVDLGTITWVPHASISNVYTGNGRNLPRWFVRDGATANAICSAYKLVTSASGGVADIDFSIAMGTDSSTNIYVHDSRFSDISEFVSAINGVQLVYEIRDPFEITLEPVQIAAIVGQTNNVWSDAGNVTVEFAADLKWYIDNKVAGNTALILEIGG